ncbi:GNAT family N-acetyltransferase [Streptomyces sp. NBC_00210]|uniref:GNAT family N-acetyltransferase n=1 Tax=unclassified Streptomyces TaxID=2593676 RepID=UPI0032521FE9
MSNEARIRRIADGDWDGIVAMESRAYADLGLSEGRAALESRVRVSPTTCCALDLGPRLAGYLLALPYPMFRYPDLDRTEKFAFPSRNLHLHDLVIAEGFRRRGLAQRLLHHLTTVARSHGYEQISLVAVAGSETFWSARGFAGHEGVVPPGSYGPGAVYMTRAVPGDRTGKPELTGALPRGSSSQKELG